MDKIKESGNKYSNNKIAKGTKQLVYKTVSCKNYTLTMNEKFIIN